MQFPILISQLTDTQESKEPIYDYWSQMTAGDIAYFILNDLFTDSIGQLLICRGLEALKGNCHGASETCWHDVIKEAREEVCPRSMACRLEHEQGPRLLG